jgi:hypothetical protein
LEGASVNDPKGNNYDYENIPYFLATFLQVFRTSIGDLQIPSAIFWTRIKGQELSSPTWYQYIMIYVVWFTFMFTVIFNMVMMMNFLIAIVSQAWDEV